MDLVGRRQRVQETHKLFPHVHRWVAIENGENTHFFWHISDWCYSSHPDSDDSVSNTACPCNECMDLFDKWLNGDLDHMEEYQ